MATGGLPEQLPRYNLPCPDRVTTTAYNKFLKEASGHSLEGPHPLEY